MATISDFVRTGGKGNPGRKPYFVETVIDMAEAATAKGSAPKQPRLCPPRAKSVCMRCSWKLAVSARTKVLMKFSVT